MSRVIRQQKQPLVLIIEDDKVMRLMLGDILEHDGYAIAETGDGAQGLTMYQEAQPDVVLLDVMMLEMDGFAVCRQLRALPNGDTVPILMITGLDDDHSVVQAFEAGATDYIIKPIHQTVLRHRLRRLLQVKQAEEALQYGVELQQLIAAISTEFISLGTAKIDRGINRALQTIGQFVGADRSYLFLFSGDGTTMDNTHEWAAAGIEPQIEHLKGLPIETFPWWTAKLERLESIYIPVVMDLPPVAQTEKEILQAQGIKSLVVMPMVSRSSVIGFLGFDWVQQYKDCSEEILRLLNMVGQVFANALERKRMANALCESQEKYQSVVDNIKEVIFQTDAAGRWTFLNPAWTEITGFTVAESIGQNFLNFVYPADRQRNLELFQPLIEGKEDYCHCEIRYVTKPKSGSNGLSDNYCWIEIHARLTLAEDGTILGTSGTLRDITDYKQAQEALQNARDELERRVLERTAELAVANEQLQQEVSERKRAEEQIKASLEEKVVLLQEIHHRVKNNLQIISSLLNLQSRQVEDQKVLEIFQESKHRIRSMALIHEKLYQSKNLARINFTEYVRDLIAYLLRSQVTGGQSINLEINANKFFLEIDTAVPCGLIVNELVSNALKHAFPNGREGTIRVNLYEDNGQFELKIGDNGIGFPPDINLNNTTSLGLQLVNTLVSQLEGAIEVNNLDGTEFKITFSTG